MKNKVYFSVQRACVFTTFTAWRHQPLRSGNVNKCISFRRSLHALMQVSNPVLCLLYKCWNQGFSHFEIIKNYPACPSLIACQFATKCCTNFGHLYCPLKCFTTHSSSGLSYIAH